MTPREIFEFPDGTSLSTDVVIVGGGACGLTLAHALGNAGVDVIVLESGGAAETPETAALNKVTLAPGGVSDAEHAYRQAHHGVLAQDWRDADQPYGLRLRGLGGATQAWAGKSAPFDPIDFEPRAWVPGSGWPIAHEVLAPFVRRAEAVLELGPPRYDASLWEMMGRKAPKEMPPADMLRAMFWQFSRSARAPTDMMRFGDAFRADPPPNVRVIQGATVTNVALEPGARRFDHVTVRGMDGRALSVSGRACVLAASTIENARLLLASDEGSVGGAFNPHDQLGRNLMDHPAAAVARFGAKPAAALAARFGFFSLREGGRTFLYQHGLALAETYQRQHGLLNGALFFTEERAEDDPFAALSRLLRRKSEGVMGDLATVAKSPVRVARGLVVQALESGKVPPRLRDPIIDAAMRWFPNTVANDVRFGRLPHKFTGVRVDAISEQPPDPENRVTLGEARDALGQPLPHIHWRAGDAARGNILALGRCLDEGMRAAGLAAPELADWVHAREPDQGVVIDMGHSMGTTRMSDDPSTGVVDEQCRVHGVEGLYAAGGSVMPTGGHSNPTLMMLALTLRLGDHLVGQHSA